MDSATLTRAAENGTMLKGIIVKSSHSGALTTGHTKLL